MAQQNYQSLFENLEKDGVKISPEHKTKIKDRLNQIRDYVPKIGVFGKTGVGKSSLCNALFGQDIFAISDVKACTRDQQEVLLSIGGEKGLKLLDVPGVGENSERDKEYDELYQNLLPQLDLIFWVFKGDDRAAASDELFYKRLIKRYVDAGKPFLAVINQVDKIEPFREWNEEARRPSAKQSKNIDEKRSHVAGFLGIPLHQVIPISANEKYGLMELVDSIVHALPNEQKLIMLEKIKAAEEENIAKLRAEAEEAQAKAEKAKAEAEKAKSEADRAKAEADAAKAQAEAERTRAEAERARSETKISEHARREAETGMWEVVKKAASYVADKVSSWMPWNW
jgi:small GTP-binding protein